VHQKPFCFVSDGSWPFQHCLHGDAGRKGVALAAHYMSFFDLRATFLRANPESGSDAGDVISIARALSINTEGVYVGIDKCELCCKILGKLLDQGASFTTPESITIKESSLTPAVLRLRGLPWQAGEQEIRDFMRGFDLHEVYLVTNNGRATGEAFVRLGTQEEAAQAVSDRHRQSIGHRYIEVFSSSQQEYDTAVSRAGGGLGRAGSPSSAPGVAVLKCRGLPFNTTAHEIASFFDTTPISASNVQIVTAHDGRANGEAFVEFSSVEESRRAMADKNRERIGHRYIELFESTVEERSSVIIARSGGRVGDIFTLSVPLCG